MFAGRGPGPVANHETKEPQDQTERDGVEEPQTERDGVEEPQRLNAERERLSKGAADSQPMSSLSNRMESAWPQVLDM